MARLAAAVALAFVGVAGCADSHGGGDAGAAVDAEDARDAFVPEDAVTDAGIDAPDSGAGRVVVRILATDVAGGVPTAGAAWAATSEGGTSSSGVTDGAGISMLDLDPSEAPFEIAVVVGGVTYYVRDVRASMTVRVHADAPYVTPGDREVTVQGAGTSTEELVAVAGRNTYAGSRAVGPPPRAGFRWRDPARPVDAVAFAFVRRFFVYDEDVVVPLPDGSGTPRTMAVVARGAMETELPDSISVDLSTGPAPARVPMRIHVVGEGSWSPRGPIDRVLAGVPLDPQFEPVLGGGFEGSLAIFDDAAARPGSFEIGPHDSQWTARVPGVVDFTVPRADGRPVIVGDSLSSATVSAAAPAWSQILVRIWQRRGDGSEARARWIARPTDRALSVLPPDVTLADLGIEPGGADVGIRVDTLHLIDADADLDVSPLYYVASSELTAISMLTAR